MKNLTVLFIVFIITACCSGCVSTVEVDGGEEAVFIYQPWLPWSTEGVDMEPLTDGLSWKVFSTKYVIYNVKPVTIEESFVDLTSSDNVPIDFDSYLTLKIINGKSPLVHKVSGKSWYSF